MSGKKSNGEAPSQEPPLDSLDPKSSALPSPAVPSTPVVKSHHPPGATAHSAEQPKGLLENASPIKPVTSQQAARTRKASVRPQFSRSISSSANTPSYHKQYIMLPSKQQTQMAVVNPGEALPADSPYVTKSSGVDSPHSRRKSKQNPPIKYVFSVDDGEDEIEADINREYMEGYRDGLKQRLKKTKSKGTKLYSPIPGPKKKSTTASGSERESLVEQLESEVSKELSKVSKDLDRLEILESDPHAHKLLFNEETTVPDPIEEDESNSSSQIRHPVPIPGESNENEEFIDESSHLDGYHEGDEDQDGFGSKNTSSDSASISSLESFTLRERQDAINNTHPFGVRIWKPALYKKIRSVQKEADYDIHQTPLAARHISWDVSLSNHIYSATLGLFLFLVLLICSAVTFFFTFFTNPKKDDSLKYAKQLYSIGFYLLNPFGKIVLLRKEKKYYNEDEGVGSSLDEYRRWRTDEEQRLFYAPKKKHRAHSTVEREAAIPHHSYGAAGEESIDTTNEEDDAFKIRLFGRGKWNIGRVIFFILFYLIIQPFLVIISICAWLTVFAIPLAKTAMILDSHVRRHPLGLVFRVEKNYHYDRRGVEQSNESILICTYRAVGWHYYKYTVDGTNIYFINLLFLVAFTIFDFYLLKEKFGFHSILTDSSTVFLMCLISIIPLAYFIGQAVASISAQTSMGVGAVINAFFSTIVEIFLYCVALNQDKSRLVEGSIVGSILAAVLLLPGLSMCSGALKRKTQRYNPTSAGVSSTMLLYATIVLSLPSILSILYGGFQTECVPCPPEQLSVSPTCRSCHFYHNPLDINGPLYTAYIKPFSLICAIALFFAYSIGLLFTLKTHAALIWSTPTVYERPKVEGSNAQVKNNAVSHHRSSLPNVAKAAQEQTKKEPSSVQPNPEADSSGHDAPNWSRTKSTVILLSATLLYAVIAEILVDTVDVILVKFPISPKLLGLTVFALVPNTTEFVNAISFALNGNVALSMEIGSAYALQVCLLQIPALVIYTIIHFTPTSSISSMFTLVFPRWDIIACFTSAFMFTYIYAEGKSNYFKGAMLILIYLTVMIGFFLADRIDEIRLE
ncbi:BA75_04677T0 [Komagataella pastoris]|uniref:BA75_04677T0 n=1 Tax=Komagataella pastoris TaxID=4922 RepID=A0A1B2JJ17_PICPA|nr:BA75_04677T0 [Komagataella pastoris]